MSKRYFPLLLTLLLLYDVARSQDTLYLSMDEAIAIARENAVDALIAKNRFNNRYWEFRSFQASLKPSLVLSARLPDFSRSISAIPQQDGTQLFLNRSLATSTLNLNLSQEVGITGGRIFAGTGLDRIDLFEPSDSSFYLGSPFFLGIEQPLLRYNPFKWSKKIEPLKLEESEKNYLEEMEQVAVTTVNRFFDYLLAEMNMEIARFNLANDDTIFKISKGRYNLGKIAENDLLQIELKVLNSEASLSQAQIDLEISASSLLQFLGLDENLKLKLLVPADVPNLQVDEYQALEYARQYRSEPVEFERMELEAEEEVARAKGENGFNANISASFGFNKSAENLGELYSNPENFLNVGVGLQIPILDWGKARSDREIAYSNKDLILSTLKQSTINFEQEVLLQVKQFNLQARQVVIAAKADTVGQKRYKVSKQRYLIGKIDITEFNNASVDRDASKRSYIESLRSYWTDFYNVRRLTLFDYTMNKPLVQEDR